MSRSVNYPPQNTIESHVLCSSYDAAARAGEEGVS
jgi:hypothetical protein